MQELISSPKDPEEIQRALSTLSGIVNGIASDGHLDDLEIHFLSGWLNKNQFLENYLPAKKYYQKIREILADGVIMEDERKSFLNDLKNHSTPRETLLTSLSHLDSFKQAIRLAFDGEYFQSRQIAKTIEDPFACWILAVLHKIEGDEDGSRFWYRRTEATWESYSDPMEELQKILEQLGCSKEELYQESTGKDLP